MKMSSGGTSRSEGLGVEVCALSALCALCVEVCALSALCVEVCALSALCAISPRGWAAKTWFRSLDRSSGTLLVTQV